ncbi:MAG: exo-alpha-sialidase [Lentisphaeria bacterium]|nr:exo-alpha-sialidase [Lentisphaeria bacterium]
MSSSPLNLHPGPEYHTRNRFWQGCPTILRTPRGRLFAGWYSGGTGEPDPHNYCLLVRSEDDGMNWSEPKLVIPSEPEKGWLNIDIELWLDPLGRMWLFYTQRRFGGGMKITDPEHLALWAAVCDDPDADMLQWHEPRIVSRGFLRTQPTVLSNGDWVMCDYDWTSPKYHYSRSSDQGKTWIRCEAGKKLKPNFDEGMILEKKDHSLLMLLRDSKPLLVQCTSPDLNGSAWTDGEYLSLLGASSRFFLRRLQSGRVLLIRNDAVSRTDLCAFLSEDDGASWPYRLPLDSAVNPTGNISYPDAVEAPDGRIFIIYDCGRNSFKEIRMAQITEADIISGSLTNYGSYRHRIISKAPGYPPDAAKFEKIRAEHDRWLKEVFFPAAKG